MRGTRIRRARLASAVALVVCLGGLTLTGVATANAINDGRSGSASGATVGAHASVSFGQQIVNDAMNYAGTPYCWDGGNVHGPTHGDGNEGSEADDCGGPSSGPGSIVGFDCTGLALYAINKAGGPDLFYEAHSPNIVNYGTPLPITSPTQLGPSNVGDILVFGSGAGLHVGIYAGIVDGKREMVDSNTTYPGRPNGVYEEPVAWETYDASYQLTHVLQFSPVAPPPPPPVPTKTSAANHVLRVSATGTAYFVDASGVPHWIPDALTYDCDVAKYPLWNDVTQSQVNSLGDGQPWATRCARPQDAANHILVVSATNTSYLADANGTIHWIPTAAIFDCLTDEGYPVLRDLTQPQVNVLGNGQPWATCSTAPPASDASVATFTETTGSVAHTWTDAQDAGGTEGPEIDSGQSVQIACRTTGFTVADGNTWWYEIASSPWDSSYWVSADAFYNNGETSGSLLNTPYFDPAVPVCASSPITTTTTTSPTTAGTYAETAGSVAHTWTNYENAGGSEGQEIASNETVQVTCRASGFAVADGNTWWYEVASSPWSNVYWVSADAFYNDGATSGSLLNTPFFDPAVPVCGSSPTMTPTTTTTTTTAPASVTYAETTGSVAHTWTDYQDAGGTEGQEIASNETVQVTCRASGFAVADGNTWWYEVASSPWSNVYWVSADAFYNDGATSGSLLNTPFFDPAVPVC
jgi:hypothetical protein